LATGCSSPKEATATTKTGESTFSASEVGMDASATTESGAAEVSEENPAIALTKIALAKTDWISIQAGSLEKLIRPITSWKIVRIGFPITSWIRQP